MYNDAQAMNLLQSFSKKIIFNYIRVNEFISRSELSPQVGMSATAITRTVNDFIRAGMVQEVGVCDVDSVGRKPIKLSVCKDCMYALGVSIDLGELAMGCANVNGEIVYLTKDNHCDCQNPEDVVRHIAQMYQDVMAHLPAKTRAKIIGMGASVPGLIRWPEGHTTVTPQLHWQPFPLQERLREILDIEILVDNNVKAIATAESMFGNKRKMDSFFVLELGSGLGAAYVLDGKVLRGYNGILGEIGHSLAVEDGEMCDCGRRGCLQAYTCITGLENRLKMPIQEIMRRKDEDGVRAVLEEAVYHLSATVANIANYYNPEQIILTGRLFDLWPELFEQLKRRSSRLQWRAISRDVQLQFSSIQSDNLQVLAAASVLFSDVLLPEVMIRKSVLNHEKRFNP